MSTNALHVHSEEENVPVLDAFVTYMDFSKLEFDTALRYTLHTRHVIHIISYHAYLSNDKLTGGSCGSSGCQERHRRSIE
jgi:hypothetical protein